MPSNVKKSLSAVQLCWYIHTYICTCIPNIMRTKCPDKYSNTSKFIHLLRYNSAKHWKLHILLSLEQSLGVEILWYLMIVYSWICFKLSFYSCKLNLNMHRLLDLKYRNKQVKGDWTEVKMLFASTCLPKLNPAEKIYSIVHLFKYNMPSFDKRKSRPLFRIRGPKRLRTGGCVQDLIMNKWPQKFCH